MKNKEKFFVIGIIVIFIFIIVFSVATSKPKKNVGNQSNNSDGEEQQVIYDNEGNAYYYDESNGKYYNDNGEYFNVGDTSLTAEDLVFNYVKAASLLDFRTASSYVSENISSLEELYSDVYSEDNLHSLNKLLINSFVVEKIKDTVTLSDSVVLTFDLSHLNMSDNDFWEKDKDKLFKDLDKMYSDDIDYNVDSTVEKYLADYLVEYFSEEGAVTTTSEVEFYITENIDGSLVIQSDRAISELCSEYNGSSIIHRIMGEYSAYIESLEEEQYYE